jgi:spore coat protein A
LVTRIIVRFEGYAGRYVWHCHILEHEDNEMMQPFEWCPPGEGSGLIRVHSCSFVAKKNRHASLPKLLATNEHE